MDTADQDYKDQIENLKKMIIEHENLASIGLKVSGIIHEIKNPLNFVLNFSLLSKEMLHEIIELAKKQPLNCEQSSEIETVAIELEDILSKIYENGKRAEFIIQTILAQSRGKTKPQFEQTNLHDLIRQAFGLAYSAFRNENPKYSLSVTFNFDANLAPFMTSASDLQRVFLNLFDNACYATNAKKKNNPNYTPSLSITTRNESDKLIIIIEDNGTGIPEKVKEHLFQPFFSNKPKGSGTGLGLTISNNIVTALHGEIKVESQPDTYTRFTIQLPKLEPSSNAETNKK